MDIYIYIYLFIYIYIATAYIIIYLHIDFHVTVLDIPNARSKKTLGLTAGHVEIFPTGPSLRIKGWSWGSLPPEPCHFVQSQSPPPKKTATKSPPFAEGVKQLKRAHNC